MSLPRDPFENRSIVLTSASSAATYDPPIGWVQVVAAGAVVMVSENGDAVSFPLAACSAGAVLRGPFAGFTSTASACLYLGDGEPPAAAVAVTPPTTDADYTAGTALTDTATTTVNRAAKRTSFLLAGTMTQGETITLGTVGAVQGDQIKIIRTSTSAQTAAIVNGGAGAGTLVTLPASKINFAVATFNGTNWLLDMCGTQ
jgi:hypothetical protein